MYFAQPSFSVFEWCGPYLSLYIQIKLFSFLVPGCANVVLVGNGFCNDETNNPVCNYDGGDCCVVNANLNSCSERACHFLETCVAGYHPLVGNGFCNDDTNIAECEYDGGDCCGYNINSEHCTECTCFIHEMCVAGVVWMRPTIQSATMMVGTAVL